MFSNVRLILGLFAAMGLVLSGCNCGPDDPPVGCEPETCESLGYDCGVHDDGCGGTISCDDCETGYVCVGGTCQPCVPDTCADIDAECGVHPDGCGGTVDCEGCPDGFECQAGECVPEECTPYVCGALDCGIHDDGCDGTVDCGGCPTGYSCDDGTCIEDDTPCVPTTCADLGYNCGVHDDDCGGTVNCGHCMGQYYECQDGICVCVPRTCEQLGRQCGEWNDGCGDRVTCGPCEEGYDCREWDGSCIASCVPSLSCDDVDCGLINDGCGEILDCGGCPGDEVCGAVDPNMCGEGECVPRTCDDVAFECGTHSDGCGDTFDCPPCPAGERCDNQFMCVSEGLADGEPCTDDDDCAGLFCIAEDVDGYWRDGYCSRGCNDDADCSDGAICSSFGVCLLECSNDDDCRDEAYVCFEDEDGQDVCFPGAGGPGAVGDACEMYWDCGGGVHGFCIAHEAWPSGYCSIVCETDDGIPCPDGSECWVDDDYTDICMATCTEYSDCRLDDGYTCWDVGGAEDWCIPGCDDDSDCAPYYCDPDFNICVECREDTHCADNEICQAGSCVPDPTVACDINGFTAELEAAGADEDILVYIAYSSEALPSDDMYLFWDLEHLPVPGIGTYDFDPTATYEDCTLCLFIESLDSGENLTNFFFATHGTVEITEIGGDGDTFAGKLIDVVLVDLIETGTWCIDEYTWSVELEGELPPPGCESDTDCSDPTPICNTDTGQCVECLDDGDCDAGEECVSFTCMPEGTEIGHPGDACDSDWDCDGDGAFCYLEFIDGWEGGYCMQDGCTTDPDCISGVCVGGYCYAGCQDAADCERDGYDCYTDYGLCYPYADGQGAPGDGCVNHRDCDGGFHGICATQDRYGYTDGLCVQVDCTQDADCGTGSVCIDEVCWGDCSAGCRAGYECYTDDNACYPYGDGQGEAGDPCTSIADCSGGFNGICWTDAIGYPDGYCTAYCSLQDGSCPGGGACYSSEAWGDDYGRCLDECTSDDQCRAGYYCLNDAVCWPLVTIIDETLREGQLPPGWSDSDVRWTTEADGYAHLEEQTSFVETPELDLSGYDQVTLQFDFARFGTGADGPITVEISDDGGATWTAQEFDTAYTTGSTYQTSGPTEITSLTGQVIIRFTRINSPSQKRLRDVLLVAR